MKGCIIIAVVVMVFTTFFLVNSSLFKKSHTIRYIRAGNAILKKVTREDIKAKYDEKLGKKKPASPKQN